MNKISAEIIADSVDTRGNRITSFLLTFPRFILPELLTHRMFSRNSASSRAIPFEKMVESAQNDPFAPIAWQKEHKGMQGTEYFTDEREILECQRRWRNATNRAIQSAMMMNGLEINISKQLCNRLLEPFLWNKVLVTATHFDNFFDLRCPKILHEANGKIYNSLKDWNNVDKDIQYNGLSCMHPNNSSQAEIHIQALAEAMWDARNESKPQLLQDGQWHLPFSNKINNSELSEYSFHKKDGICRAETPLDDSKLRVCTAKCARLSYMTFDNGVDYAKDIQLHDQLLENRHFSCFEHCARAMTHAEVHKFIKGRVSYSMGKVTNNDEVKGWCNNFKGFIPYRYLIESNE